MLRDRLVCGVNHTGNQRKLLSEGDLTYDSTLKYQSTIGDFKGTFSSIACYRCGGPHLANRCKHKDVTCHFCKKIGDFASVCRLSPGYYCQIECAC